MLKTSAESKTSLANSTAKSGTEADGLQRDQTNRSLVQASGLDPSTNTTHSRCDPITGSWTIFAPHREQRPDEFQARGKQEPEVKVECPFCVGAESNTPPAVWVGKLVDSDQQQSSAEPTPLIYRDEEIAGLPVDDWTVRVVPNRFPAITPLAGPVGGRPQSSTKPLSSDAPQRNGQGRRDSDLFRSQVICGGHEVIIEAPQHVRSITELDLTEVALLFNAYRDRMAHWYQTPGIAYISVFKNVGGQAGASLKHSHSQLIASDIIPTQVKLIAGRLAKYRAKTGCCLQCDLIRGELKEESRVIANTDSLVAYCPFASSMPMMVRVTSVEHLDRFDQLSEQMLGAVSRMVSRVVSWLENLHPGTAYNLLLHSRPPGIKDGVDTHHWAIDIFPRLSRIAGFEFSTNCNINPMMPEMAATRYRDCASAEDPRLVLRTAE